MGMIILSAPISVLMGGIGVISLAGIVVNNAIVLIDYIRQLREKGIPSQDAIVIAGMVRLRPVVLTAVTTILGLLPITIGMDINFYRWPDIVVFGSEGGTFWKPMNHAIIYGLTVATFLTLFMVPVMYSMIESLKANLPRLGTFLYTSAKSPRESMSRLGTTSKPMIATAKAKLHHGVDKIKELQSFRR